MLPELAAWRRRERERSVTQGWRYQISWTGVPDPYRSALSGTWLLVVPAGPAADENRWGLRTGRTRTGRSPAAGELARACERAIIAAGAQVVIAEAADRAHLAGRISGCPR